MARFLLSILIPESLGSIPVILLHDVECTECATRDTSISSATNKRCPTKTPACRRHRRQIQLLLPSLRRKAIVLYKKHEDHFPDVPFKRRSLWGSISRAINEEGYFPYPAHCENRWKSLLSSFRKYVDNSNKSTRVSCHFAFRIVVFVCCEIPIILIILILEKPQKTHPKINESYVLEKSSNPQLAILISLLVIESLNS